MSSLCTTPKYVVYETPFGLMNIPRIEATHFREVWKHRLGPIITDSAMDLRYLKDSLNTTLVIDGRTIAIWKIKYHEPISNAK